MLSFIMMAGSVHHARSMEVNKQMMNYIIQIGWLFAIMVPLVVIYAWYRAKSNCSAAQIDGGLDVQPRAEVRDAVEGDTWSDF